MAKHKGQTTQDDLAPHERLATLTRPSTGGATESAVMDATDGDDEAGPDSTSTEPEINPIDGRPMMTAEQIADSRAAHAAGVTSAKPAAKTKRERFLALAPKRVNKALKALAAVARCADVRSYEFTPDERVKIVAYVNNGADAVAEAFNGAGAPKAAFTL